MLLVLCCSICFHIREAEIRQGGKKVSKCLLIFSINVFKYVCILTNFYGYLCTAVVPSHEVTGKHLEWKLVTWYLSVAEGVKLTNVSVK